MIRFLYYRSLSLLDWLQLFVLTRWWFVTAVVAFVLIQYWNHTAEEIKNSEEREINQLFEQLNPMDSRKWRTERTAPFKTLAARPVSYQPQQEKTEKSKQSFLETCKEANAQNSPLSEEELRMFAARYEDAKTVVEQAKKRLEDGRRRMYWMDQKRGNHGLATKSANETIKRHFRLGTISDESEENFKRMVTLESQLNKHPIMEYFQGMEKLGVEAKLDSGNIGRGDVLAMEGSVRAACCLIRIVHLSDVAYQMVLEQVPQDELKGCHDTVFEYYVSPTMIQALDKKSKSPYGNRDYKLGDMFKDPLLGKNTAAIQSRIEWLANGPDFLWELAFVRTLRKESNIEIEWPVYANLTADTLMGSPWKAPVDKGR